MDPPVMDVDLKSLNINSVPNEENLPLKTADSIGMEANSLKTNEESIAMDTSSPITVAHPIPTKNANSLMNETSAGAQNDGSLLRDGLQDIASLGKKRKHFFKVVNTSSKDTDLLTKGGDSVAMDANSFTKNESPVPMDADSSVCDVNSFLKDGNFSTPNENSLNENVNSPRTFANPRELIFKTPENGLKTSTNNTPITPDKNSTPKKPRTPAAEANYRLCKNRLDAIVKVLKDNYAKWMLAQSKGLNLCYQIESQKIKTWEKNKDSNGSVSNMTTEYNDTLKKYCEKLALITSIFVDITRNTKEILKQVTILEKLPGIADEVFYYSWQIKDLINFLCILVDRYSRELSAKIRVTETIAHCKSTPELIRCIAAWEYPQEVNNYLQFQFATLQGETVVTTP